MPLRDDLLNPIAGASPAGVDLRYDPIYDKIKEARREDDDIPSGGWDAPRKLADWQQVVKLASEAVATKSKGLQIASWLTEAMLRREGLAGLALGCGLLKGILDQYWDGCLPEAEDGDLELRAAPLEWVGTRFDFAVKSVALCKAGHNFWKYKESRAIPTETDVEADESRAPQRAAALDDGKLAPELFDKALAETPQPWYRQLQADMTAARDAVSALDAAAAERFGSDGPNLLPLRTSLEEVEQVVNVLVDRKLAADPDPLEAGSAPDAGQSAVYEAGSGGTTSSAPSGLGGAPRTAGPLAAEPVDVNDAAACVIGAARFMRKHDPTSPTSYLMLRALRFGELRAQGPTPDPRLLDAPSAQARTQLKTLMLDGDWVQLLEVAETVMGTPAGRGWLDLQRYLLNALEALGDEYARSAQAVRREVKTLLAEIPALPEMTLMDDLPTAGPSTLAWLRSEGMMGDAAESDDAAPRAAMAPSPSPTSTDRALERALAEVKAGRTPQAIEMIKRELQRESSERGRFMRQVQLATVMVAAGRDAVAIPGLQKLLGVIDGHKLDGWEEGRFVAEPMSLLYQALESTGGDSEQRQALYLRICELDPMAAIGFGQEATAGDGEGS